MTTGEKIQKYRKKAGLSQGELASKLGKSQRTVCNYETDTIIPKTKALEKIASILNVESSDLAADKETTLADVISWGQAYDDEAIEVIKSFKKFYDGFNELCNIGDWWELMNQGSPFDDVVKEQWKKLEDIDVMMILDTIAMALAGTYVRFDKFTEGCINAFENGHGFRHKETKEN